MKTLKERFEDKIFYSPDGCWYWIGAVIPAGYGVIAINARAKIASRVSYQLYVGEIPDGLFVCHSCDNTICVNPNHLFLGTATDNMLDMASKNRHAYPKGNDAWRSKLTEYQVLSIKLLLGRMTQKDIAELFNVSKSAISHIKHGRSWGHI